MPWDTVPGGPASPHPPGFLLLLYALESTNKALGHRVEEEMASGEVGRNIKPQACALGMKSIKINP